MKPFDYTRPAGAAEAVTAVAGDPGASYIGGGTNLVDHMKLGIAEPTSLVDVRDLLSHRIEELPDGGLRVGAAVPNSDLAAHPGVRRDYPVLSQALLAGASGQLRNAATTGGNLLQRTRCVYFQNTAMPCNKREPGTGCSAIEGYGRYNAVLGTSEHCVATHPSDLAVALAALEATVHLADPDGERSVALADFLLQPGSTPDREHAVRPGELITSVEIPAHPRPLRSGYLKVRDRQSFAFALASAAVALHLRGGVIREAKVAAGGVGTMPWKLPAVEQHLRGQRPSAALWAEAAARAADGARALAHNGFKVDLLERTVERQLRTVGGNS